MKWCLAGSIWLKVTSFEEFASMNTNFSHGMEMRGDETHLDGHMRMDNSTKETRLTFSERTTEASGTLLVFTLDRLLYTTSENPSFR